MAAAEIQIPPRGHPDVWASEAVIIREALQLPARCGTPKVIQAIQTLQQQCDDLDQVWSALLRALQLDNGHVSYDDVIDHVAAFLAEAEQMRAQDTRQKNVIAKLQRDKADLLQRFQVRAKGPSLSNIRQKGHYPPSQEQDGYNKDITLELLSERAEVGAKFADGLGHSRYQGKPAVDGDIIILGDDDGEDDDDDDNNDDDDGDKDGEDDVDPGRTAPRRDKRTDSAVRRNILAQKSTLTRGLPDIKSRNNAEVPQLKVKRSTQNADQTLPLLTPTMKPLMPGFRHNVTRGTKESQAGVKAADPERLRRPDKAKYSEEVRGPDTQQPQARRPERLEPQSRRPEPLDPQSRRPEPLEPWRPVALDTARQTPATLDPKIASPPVLPSAGNTAEGSAPECHASGSHVGGTEPANQSAAKVEAEDTTDADADADAYADAKDTETDAKDTETDAAFHVTSTVPLTTGGGSYVIEELGMTLSIPPGADRPDGGAATLTVGLEFPRAEGLPHPRQGTPLTPVITLQPHTLTFNRPMVVSLTSRPGNQKRTDSLFVLEHRGSESDGQKEWVKLQAGSRDRSNTVCAGADRFILFLDHGGRFVVGEESRDAADSPVALAERPLKLLGYVVYPVEGQEEHNHLELELFLLEDLPYYSKVLEYQQDGGGRPRGRTLVIEQSIKIPASTGMLTATVEDLMEGWSHVGTGKKRLDIGTPQGGTPIPAATFTFRHEVEQLRCLLGRLVVTLAGVTAGSAKEINNITLCFDLDQISPAAEDQLMTSYAYNNEAESEAGSVVDDPSSTFITTSYKEPGQPSKSSPGPGVEYAGGGTAMPAALDLGDAAVNSCGVPDWLKSKMASQMAIRYSSDGVQEDGWKSLLHLLNMEALATVSSSGREASAAELLVLCEVGQVPLDNLIRALGVSGYTEAASTLQCYLGNGPASNAH